MNDVPTPGWYHAEGDPPNTQRYWDGSTWQGGPQPTSGSPSSTQPPLGSAAGAGGMASAGTMPIGGYLESSQATMSLVLAILGLACCGILSPISWVISQKEITAIDDGRRDPTNRGVAVAGKVIGIIGTVLWVLGILAIVFFGVVVASSET